MRLVVGWGEMGMGRGVTTGALHACLPLECVCVCVRVRVCRGHSTLTPEGRRQGQRPTRAVGSEDADLGAEVHAKADVLEDLRAGGGSSARVEGLGSGVWGLGLGVRGLGLSVFVCAHVDGLGGSPCRGGASAGWCCGWCCRGCCRGGCCGVVVAGWCRVCACVRACVTQLCVLCCARELHSNSISNSNIPA
jgi:hypothetical protein